MVVCLESYIGDSVSAQGVELEDQFLIADTGAERLTTYPFSEPMLSSFG
jgi:Xaa-Pro dipeptidase